MRKSGVWSVLAGVGVLGAGLAGCSSASSSRVATRQERVAHSAAPIVLSSEFSSGRVVASDGMGAAMVNASDEPTFAAAQDE